MILKQELTVTHDMLASQVGSGSVAVFSTPSMIAFMESLCSQLAETICQEGETSVGIEVNVQHLRAIVENEVVIGQVELKNQEKNLLVFRTRVFHNEKIVGDGLMKRVIVNKQQFEEKAGL